MAYPNSTVWHGGQAARGGIGGTLPVRPLGAHGAGGTTSPGGVRPQHYQPENILTSARSDRSLPPAAATAAAALAAAVARDAASPLDVTTASSRTAVDMTAGTIASVATGTSESRKAPAGGAHWKAACEGQLSWLEEDIAILSRRVKKDCGEFAGPPAEIAELIARLDADSAAERQSRMQLDARLKALEDAVSQQHEEREKDLQMTSNDVESAMKGLIGRIDEGLSAGASSMRQRTEQTEQALRTLIKRVDEGLCAGANALQSTLGNKLAFNPPAISPRRSKSPQPTSPDRLEKASLEGSLRSPPQRTAPGIIEKASLEGSSQSQNRFAFRPSSPVPMSPTRTEAGLGTLGKPNAPPPSVSGGTLPVQAARPAAAGSRPSWMSPGTRTPAAHSPTGTPLPCPPSLQVPGTGLSSLRSRACSPNGACAPMGKSMVCPVSPNGGSRAMTPIWPIHR